MLFDFMQTVSRPSLNCIRKQNKLSCWHVFHSAAFLVRKSQSRAHQCFGHRLSTGGGDRHVLFMLCTLLQLRQLHNSRRLFCTGNVLRQLVALEEHRNALSNLLEEARFKNHAALTNTAAGSRVRDSPRVATLPLHTFPEARMGHVPVGSESPSQS